MPRWTERTKKKYHKAYHAIWYQKNKKKALATARRSARASIKFIREQKKDPCRDCRHRFPPECMHFDHVRGKKRYNVSQMAGWSKESIMKEIAKCELVCANCHAIRTTKRRRRKK